MDDIYESIAGLRRRGEKAILATIVSTRGSAPRKEGSKMLVLPGGKINGTIGGGAIEYQAIKESLALMDGNKAKLAHFELTNADASKEGMTCGGIVDVFLEPIKPFPTLIVFGGGHISFFIAKLGKMLDFRVIILDDRPEFANPERFPEVDETIAGNMAAAKDKLNINSSAFIVIVTRGHLNDGQVLEWTAKTNAAYVGMIGSKRKIKMIFEKMLTKGVTQAELARVHTPIGLEIGAETPEEIAVAIMAEIIQIKHQQNGK